MAAAAAAGILDPTKPGEYPVVLSDALLGKLTNREEVYSGIRCEQDLHLLGALPLAEWD